MEGFTKKRLCGWLDIALNIHIHTYVSLTGHNLRRNWIIRMVFNLKEDNLSHVYKKRLGKWYSTIIQLSDTAKKLITCIKLIFTFITLIAMPLKNLDIMTIWWFCTKIRIIIHCDSSFIWQNLISDETDKPKRYVTST